MTKIEMREWVASVEGAIDVRLKPWKKESRIENGEAVQIGWQFEQTHILMDIFWQDGKESVIMRYMAPHANHQFFFHGLNNETVNRIMDRVGNLAQITMHPPIIPRD